MVSVEVRGLLSSPDSMTVTTLNSTQGTAENTFDQPFLVSILHIAVLLYSILSFVT